MTNCYIVLFCLDLDYQPRQPRVLGSSESTDDYGGRATDFNILGVSELLRTQSSGDSKMEKKKKTGQETETKKKR